MNHWRVKNWFFILVLQLNGFIKLIVIKQISEQ